MQENELVRFVPLLGDRIAAINEAKKIIKRRKASEQDNESGSKEIFNSIVGDCGELWAISLDDFHPLAGWK